MVAIIVQKSDSYDACNVRRNHMSKAEEKKQQTMIPVFIMGKRYEVPEGLTIMKAMEYAGYQFIRGCGCRGGI